MLVRVVITHKVVEIKEMMQQSYSIKNDSKDFEVCNTS